MIYWSIFTFVLFGGLVTLDCQKKARLLFIIASTVIFLIVATRYNSVDYQSYLRIYEGIGDLGKLDWFIYSLDPTTPIETGFAFLIIFEKYLYGNYFAFIFLFSLISLSIKFFAFYKMSPYVLISILIYLSDEYFWKDMGQIRNSMASGIILWSFFYAYQRRFILFLICVYAAIMFHSAAIIALPFYFARLLSSRLVLFSILIFSLLVVITTGGIGSLIASMAQLVGATEDFRIIKHLNSHHVDGIKLFGGTFLLQLALCCAVLGCKRFLVLKWKLNEFLIPAYVIGSSLFFLFLDYGIIAGRIREMITVPIGCVLLPSFILIFKKDHRFIPVLFITIYCLLWFFMMISAAPKYQSIFMFL